jgi:hypothetical protein
LTRQRGRQLDLRTVGLVAISFGRPDTLSVTRSRDGFVVTTTRQPSHGPPDTETIPPPLFEADASGFTAALTGAEATARTQATRSRRCNATGAYVAMNV